MQYALSQAVHSVLSIHTLLDHREGMGADIVPENLLEHGKEHFRQPSAAVSVMLRMRSKISFSILVYPFHIYDSSDL